jgi:hypothetical protein
MKLSKHLTHVIPAPEWLKRSNALQMLKQKPTLENVRQQMKASAEFPKKMVG